MKKNVFFLFLTALLPVSSFAGGYLISLQGIRQMAMGHTGVGIAMDASNVFFNPAGLSYLKSKLAVSTGVSILWDRAHYQNTDTWRQYQTDSPTGTPLDCYAAYKLNDRLSVGLGFYTPFGSQVEWPEDWTGRTLVTSVDLKSLFFQPTVSYKLRDWLSLGGGLIIASGAVNLQRADLLAAGAKVELDKHGITRLGYKLSLMVKPLERLTLGIDYRSEIDMEAEGGDASFIGFPASIFHEPSSPLQTADDRFDASLPLPAELSVGLSYRVGQKWLLAGDLNYTYWSAYDALRVHFQTNQAASFTTPRNYENTFIYRLGAQYLCTPRLTVRLGYYRDQSPSPDSYWSPETPTTDNDGFTAGFSYAISKRLACDLAYLYVNGNERSVHNKTSAFYGDVYAQAHVFGLGITFNL